MSAKFDTMDGQSDRILPPAFYAQKPHELARGLLGRDLIVEHETGGFRRGRIVETEAYGFVPDPASHSYRGIMTRRNRAMFGQPGHAYIYLIYGVYHCFNVVSLRGERPSAILIRALHPLDGIPEMARVRGIEGYDQEATAEGVNTTDSMSQRDREKLLSGPGKLCQAMQIELSLDEHPLWMAPLYICEGAPKSVRDNIEILRGPRIGLNPKTVGESFNWPWRYEVGGSRYLSRVFT